MLGLIHKAMFYAFQVLYCDKISQNKTKTEPGLYHTARLDMLVSNQSFVVSSPRKKRIVMDTIQEVGVVAAAAESSFRAHCCIHHFLVRWAPEVGGVEAEEAEAEASRFFWRTISSPE